MSHQQGRLKAHPEGWGAHVMALIKSRGCGGTLNAGGGVTDEAFAQWVEELGTPVEAVMRQLSVPPESEGRIGDLAN